MENLYDSLYDDIFNSENPDANLDSAVLERISAGTDINSLSKYYNFEEYETITKLNENKFTSFIHVNIRSLQKNFDHLKCMLNCLPKPPHVRAVTETWLRNPSKHLYSIDGCASFHLVTTNKEQGGVSVFVKNYIHTDVLDQYCFINDNIELQSLKVKIN